MVPIQTKTEGRQIPDNLFPVIPAASPVAGGGDQFFTRLSSNSL